jgi:hypothetical protein
MPESVTNLLLDYLDRPPTELGGTYIAPQVRRLRISYSAFEEFTPRIVAPLSPFGVAGVPPDPVTASLLAGERRGDWWVSGGAVRAWR